MARTFSTWLGHIIAGILSVLLAHYGVLNVSFSEVFEDQRLGGTLYVILAYAVVALFLRLAWPARYRAWIVWLSIPAVLVFFYTTALQIQNVLIHLLTLAAAVGGAWLGLWAGKQIRKRKGPAIPPPVPPVTS
ncbi:MAG: hypothetical protein HY341_02995 [Candidatus Kerfeldbacteria bacterium]|nr:hypothetical protein [Candidatus Kerfeldbacteria bacterium]